MYAWTGTKRSWLGRWAHWATHTCAVMDKPGMGELFLCTRRLPRATTRVFYRPAFDGAGYYPLKDLEQFKRVGKAGSPEEAMAILRREAEDDH